MKYIFGLITILLFSCSKDDISTICDNNIKICENPIPLIPTWVDSCFELPSNSVGQILTNYPGDDYSRPLTNQVMEDEFIFVHRQSYTNWKVYKSNLCKEYFETGFDMTLLDNPILFDWNQNDELLITAHPHIWRVNFDGTDLVKITNDEGSYSAPEWCLNDSLIYCSFSPYNSNHPLYPGGIILLDRDGEIVHAFPAGVGKTLAAIKGNKILTSANHTGEHHLGYIELDSKEFIPIMPTDINAMDGFGFSQYVWLNNDEILYQLRKTSAQKLFKMNINTLEKELISEENCENVSSGSIASFSNNQQEVLMQRSEYRYVADHPDSLYFFQEIIKKNIVTGEEWILDINL